MIKVQNVVKNFKKVFVLRDLNLEIKPHERVALVGQNGCGKTTLIRCLLGLYHFEGDIEIFGSKIKEQREEALKKIAFVPQSPPALKNTVDEIITLTSELCGFPASDVTPIARRLGLDISRCHTVPFKGLSGGMKQKLLIACALARKPQLLIMDEPSANLDPQARSVFFKLLSELPSETTMLLTSHRVDELAGIVSRVIELDAGVITIDDIVEGGDENTLREEQLCFLEFKRMPESVKKALTDWTFSPEDENDLKWKGVISSADSFRFHATLTRWSGIIESINLRRNP